MDRASDIHDIISDPHGQRRAVRARHRRAHGRRHRRQGRRQGGDPARRHHLGRLDRRRLRPRRRGQGGQGRARRRPIAAGLGAAARRARRAGPRSRRRTGRRALRQEHVPEPGHHGHLRRAGAAAPAGHHLRRQPGGGRRSPISPSAPALPSPPARRPANRPLLPRSTAPSKAMRCRSTKRAPAMWWYRHKGAAMKPRCWRRCRSTPITSPSSAAAAKPTPCARRFSERGIAPERLAKLKAPAGLDLGAITPDEIAVSIIAEIVAVRRGKAQRGEPPDRKYIVPCLADAWLFPPCESGTRRKPVGYRQGAGAQPPLGANLWAGAPANGARSKPIQARPTGQGGTSMSSQDEKKYSIRPARFSRRRGGDVRLSPSRCRAARTPPANGRTSRSPSSSCTPPAAAPTS